MSRRLGGWSVGALLLVAVVVFTAGARAQQGLVEYVNTLRGSNSSPEYSRGNTFPAVSVPFGFNFWTPITEGNSSGWLYRYERSTVQGFGVSHEPSPWVGDRGSIQIMPGVGALKLASDARAAQFSHAREIAHPHYYSVELDSPAIRVEFTPTDHAARFRFTFPRAEDAYVLFDSVDDVHGAIVHGAIHALPSQRSVEGYVDHLGPRLYFVARSDAPFSEIESQQGAGVNAAVRFDTRENATVEWSIATSFLSLEQARANLDEEIGHRGFDEIREAAAAAWNEKLGAIEVEGATERQKITLYSCLYRAFLYPNSMWERANGKAVHFSPYDGAEHEGKIWVNNGFWDTYRAAWPLYTLLLPNQTGEMLDGFVHAYLEGGWTPRWSGPGYLDVMVGSHIDVVFADAYLKGVTNFDVQAAYASALKNALVVPDNGAHGRKGNELSIFRGYVPTSIPESAAWTLENAVNDFGISQLAAALGDGVHARYFRSRALTYTELFSNDADFFRGRSLDGSWRTPTSDFHANEWGYEYTEGNAWHYAMAANHDPEGMAHLYGGRRELSQKIDSLLAAPRDYLIGSYSGVIHEMKEAYDTDMGQYAHANEPMHHVLYIYNYAGTPSKTQAHVREIMDEARGVYGPGLGDGGGYIGDEDNGEMSAWFVFSALGFYPAAPGHPEYAIGSPLFSRATIRFPSGRRFVVSAPNNDAKNVYVQRAWLNDQVLARNFLTHAELSAGGELVLELGPTPSDWGSGIQDVPSSIRQRGRLRDRARDGQASANEGAADAAFDDDSRTEWRATSQAPWLGYRFADDRPQAVDLYTLTSGSDAAEDASGWSLEASNDGARWTEVDRRDGEHFDFRHQTRVFAVRAPRQAPFYRLRLASNGSTRVAELELLGSVSVDSLTATQEARYVPTTDVRAATRASAQAAAKDSGCTAQGRADPDAGVLALALFGLWLARRSRVGQVGRPT